MGEFTIPPSNNSAIEIHDDRGGYVDEYETSLWHYNIEGRKVKILGMCRSACLLALGARNVCVGPNAVVMAHMAYENGTGIARPDVTARMLEHLPHNIRAKLNGKIKRDYTSAATLRYAELLSLGIPSCNENIYASDHKSLKPVSVKTTIIRK